MALMLWRDRDFEVFVAARSLWPKSMACSASSTTFDCSVQHVRRQELSEYIYTTISVASISVSQKHACLIKVVSLLTTLRSNSLSDQISAMHGNSKNLFHSFQLKKYIPFIHSSSLLNSILPLLLKSLPFNSQILFPSFIHLLFSIQFCLWQLLQGCKHLDQCFGPKLFFFQVSHKFQGVQLK